MNRNQSLATSIMQIVQSTNFLATLGLLIFLLYSAFGLHNDSISVPAGIGIVVSIITVYTLILSYALFLYPMLPLVLDFTWHGRLIDNFNDTSFIASIILLGIMVMNQILVLIAVKKAQS